VPTWAHGDQFGGLAAKNAASLDRAAGDHLCPRGHKAISSAVSDERISARPRLAA
jgi:hypothetical protein